MTPDRDAARGQCKATIWAGPNSYHCTGDVGHDDWHRFVVDEEGVTRLAHVRAALAEREAIIYLHRATNDLNKERVNALRAERERLRELLRHEIYRNHEHTDACDACKGSDAALAPEAKEKRP